MIVTFNDHVLDIYFHILSNLLCKDFIHQALVRRTDVFKAEWNFLLIEHASISVEGRVFLIFQSHLDLVMAFVGVKKTFGFESPQRFDHLVYLRQG